MLSGVSARFGESALRRWQAGYQFNETIGTPGTATLPIPRSRKYWYGSIQVNHWPFLPDVLQGGLFSNFPYRGYE
ncbi:hypothetical protein ACUNV4_07765 [Granulosicoccus sp. 3-233]|uniref:hypothetical protein n=1 Tax=Granulosicoccus sp. 3-233 TaxID=3417969 RepID=UPI003D328819